TFDADSTMKLTPPQAEVPTLVDTHPTPLPRPPAVQTVAAPQKPAAPAPIPAGVIEQAPPRRGIPALLVVFFVVLFLAVIAPAAMFFLRIYSIRQIAQNTTTTTQAAVIPTPAPVPQSQTSVEVTATTASVTPPVTTTTATVAPPQPQPQPQPQPVIEKPKPKPQPQPTQTAEASDDDNHEVEATPSTSFPTYTEGGAAIANESALNVARMQLKNVKQVSLIGAGGHEILMNQVAEYLRDSGLAVVDGSDVVIYFNASLD